MTLHSFLQDPEKYRVLQISREDDHAMDWIWIWPALHSPRIFLERQWHHAQWCRILGDLKRKKLHKQCMPFFFFFYTVVSGLRVMAPAARNTSQWYLHLNIFTCCSLWHQISNYLTSLLANIFYITQQLNHFSSKRSRHRWYEHTYMDKYLIFLNSDNESYRDFTFQHLTLLI